MAQTNETVLVTGGSGFVGSHCILACLQKGYKVQTTIRNLQRSDEVRAMLKTGGATPEQAAGVQIFAADLTKDDGWEAAMKGCTYVLHVASPFPPNVPKDENELIAPARDGTLRALKLAKQSGTVKRVVVTSSVAAIAYGWGADAKDKVFAEGDWTVLDGSKGDKVPAYQKSKTIAERAAWDWIANEGEGLEMATVNPVAIFGPVLSPDFAASVQIVSRLLKGQVPAIPNVLLGIVDVRDVADLQLRAMVDPKANGSRFLAIGEGEESSFKDIAVILKKGLSAKESKRVTTRTVPDFFVKLAAIFDPAAGLLIPELGRQMRCTNKKAKETLGWEPRNADVAILASARSLIECGAVKV